MISVMKNVQIKGIVTVVPTTKVLLSDDKTLYNGNEKQLKRVMASTGFHTRRIAENAVTASDLCLEAAELLICNMGIDRKNMDAVVFVSQTPDYHIPATACILQHKLGLPVSAVAFDVNQGCAGYTYGLWMSSMMASAGCKNILLLVGDTFSRYKDMFSASKSAPIFGDAGSATLVSYDKNASPIYFEAGNDGSDYDAIIAYNGGFRNPPSDGMFKNGEFTYDSHMDGMRVMEFTQNTVPGSILNVLAAANLNKDDIDYYIMHQANKLILENLAMDLDIPLEKVPMDTLSKYGNQSCTSIPGAICDSISDEVSSKKLKLILSGFGIGFSWMSTFVEMDKIYCSGINEYKG